MKASNVLRLIIGLSSNQSVSQEPEEDEVDVRTQRVVLWTSFGILLLGAITALGIRWLSQPIENDASDAPAVSPLTKIRKSLQPRIKPPKAAFVETSVQSGIQWTQENGAVGKKYFPEAMGTGVAWVDWDNDLDPDLILISSTHWPENASDGTDGYLAAFENDGTGQFRDVTEELGLKLSFYAIGIGVGDADGDGFTDLYITALGENRLLKNVDGKRFEDVTASAGVAGAAEDYSTCAAFFDVDLDGDLDLLVGNYGVWNEDIHEKVVETVPGVGFVYHEPEALEGQFSRLYLNEGNLRFRDVSESWGLHVVEPSTGIPVGKNLGFGIGYFNNDRILDVVVANDGVRNLFLKSKTPFGFDERGQEDGFAYDRRGESTAAMGIDVERDWVRQEFRVVVGNFAEEMTSLYVNHANDPKFFDETVAEGVGPRTNNRVTFGALFLDYDLDGYRDIFEVNGGIQDVEPSLFNRVGTGYQQPGDVFWNCGGRCKTTYVYLGKSLSGDFANSIVGRGLASADIDGDGDLDLIATSVKGPAYLYRNDTDTSNNWLRIKLRGRSPNPEAIGAELVLSSGDLVQYRLVQPSRSYLSANELIQTFGLGEWDDAVSLEIVWPDGRSQKHLVETLNRVVVFDEPSSP